MINLHEGFLILRSSMPEDGEKIVREWVVSNYPKEDHEDLEEYEEEGYPYIGFYFNSGDSMRYNHFADCIGDYEEPQITYEQFIEASGLGGSILPLDAKDTKVPSEFTKTTLQDLAITFGGIKAQMVYEDMQVFKDGGLIVESKLEDLDELYTALGKLKDAVNYLRNIK